MEQLAKKQIDNIVNENEQMRKVYLSNIDKIQTILFDIAKEKYEGQIIAHNGVNYYNGIPCILYKVISVDKLKINPYNCFKEPDKILFEMTVTADSFYKSDSDNFFNVMWKEKTVQHILSVDINGEMTNAKIMDFSLYQNLIDKNIIDKNILKDMSGDILYKGCKVSFINNNIICNTGRITNFDIKTQIFEVTVYHNNDNNELFYFEGSKLKKNC